MEAALLFADRRGELLPALVKALLSVRKCA
jgi:hypothetical protein